MTNKIGQIKFLIQEPKYQPDVLGLTETLLNFSYDNDFVNTPGYHYHPQRIDKSYSTCGGVISYVSERYTYDMYDDLKISNSETIWIDIKPPNAANKLVCTVYRPNELNPLPTWSE